jgi:pyruvate-ferredoxin/flavodoxin oxidoreductase
MCNQCSFVCPHGVTRPFLVNPEEEGKAPESVKKDLQEANIKEQLLKFTIGTNYNQCTGCGLCAQMCPGKKGEKALTMVEANKAKTDEYKEKNDYLFNNVVEKPVMALNTVKGSQFKYPKFEFSGACAGCGETPYLKLLSQLYGDELVIANATGCSSIYGGSIPATSYSVPWANSLFEDNAEFGLGLEIADKIHKNKITDIINEKLDSVPADLKESFDNYAKTLDFEASKVVYENADKVPELKEFKDFIKSKSFWIVGGDGWA